MGRSPSRFDTGKLTNLNAHYLREAPDAEVVTATYPDISRFLDLRPRSRASFR